MSINVQLGDVFTKSLPEQAFKLLVDILGLIDLSEPTWVGVWKINRLFYDSTKQGQYLFLI